MKYTIDFTNIGKIPDFFRVKDKLPIYLDAKSRSDVVAEAHGFRTNGNCIDLEILFNNCQLAKNIFKYNYSKVNLNPLYIKKYKYGKLVSTELTGLIIGDIGEDVKIITVHDYDLTKEPFIRKIFRKILNLFK